MKNLILLLCFLIGNTISRATTLIAPFQNTLLAVEMNVGDSLEYTLKNGRKWIIILKSTNAKMLFTTLPELKKPITGGASIYEFTALVNIDGQDMAWKRIVGTQQSFYEPYVINGVRVFFDGVQEIFDVVTEKHGECKPGRQFRMALMDASVHISPEEVLCWYDNPRNYINFRDNYNGDDCYMGPYLGADAHGGLDINQKKGTPNYLPISVDDHYYFNSLSDDDNNNRWRGVRTWDNGDQWIIQNHHVYNLLVPEHGPLRAGMHYVSAAGVHVGSHNHAHYGFKVLPKDSSNEIILDPWILFWQAFELQKERSNELSANFNLLAPATTGRTVFFDATSSRTGITGEIRHFIWSFGDNYVGYGKQAQHVFTKPGIYPVKLIVDNGRHRDQFTQYLTVTGQPLYGKEIPLVYEDSLLTWFIPGSPEIYNHKKYDIPTLLFFTVRKTKKAYRSQKVFCKGKGDISKINISYFEKEGWVMAEDRYSQLDWLKVSGSGEESKILDVNIRPNGLPTGNHLAKVEVYSESSNNKTNIFFVQLNHPTYPPFHKETGDHKVEIVDNEDAIGFRCTNGSWMEAYNAAWKNPGYNGSYLVNGLDETLVARFNPDLAEGKYKVSFHEDTPFDPYKRVELNRKPWRAPEKWVNDSINPTPRFKVRIVHKHGISEKWMEPLKSLEIGEYGFVEGMEGYIEIVAEGARGQVIADAVKFIRLKQE